MPNIFERLKTERQRLGMSQDAFAEKCRVTARSQRNYESGERSPDAVYLSEIAEMGVDVLYVLTGVKTPQVTIPPDEQVLLDSYRRCNQQSRAHLIQTAALLSAGMSAAPISAGQHNSGEGAVLVNGSVTGGVNRGRVTRRRNTVGDA